MNICFNPRPRKGATSTGRWDTLEHGVSIHAPVRERLREEEPSLAVVKVSIHAPVRERQHSPLDLARKMSFNPRPRKGATDVPFESFGELLFQSTPP